MDPEEELIRAIMQREARQGPDYPADNNGQGIMAGAMIGAGAGMAAMNQPQRMRMPPYLMKKTPANRSPVEFITEADGRMIAAPVAGAPRGGTWEMDMDRPRQGPHEKPAPGATGRAARRWIGRGMYGTGAALAIDAIMRSQAHAASDPYAQYVEEDDPYGP